VPASRKASSCFRCKAFAAQQPSKGLEFTLCNTESIGIVAFANAANHTMWL
jgi:hypothetical protein